MSTYADVAEAYLDLRRAVKDAKNRLDGNLRPLQQESFNALLRAAERMAQAGAWSEHTELEDMLHFRYDCHEDGCTNDTCKSNPNGKCENCGTPRREGQHYSTEVWKYLCERNY